jgi:hypothetical protein
VIIIRILVAAIKRRLDGIRYLDRCFDGWIRHPAVSNLKEADVGSCVAVKNQLLAARSSVEGPRQ